MEQRGFCCSGFHSPQHLDFGRMTQVMLGSLVPFVLIALCDAYKREATSLTGQAPGVVQVGML